MIIYRYLMRVYLFLTVLSFVLFSTNALSIEKSSIERIIIFGDSLSDTGRMLSNSQQTVPSKQNYWEGRFSDGYIWVDYLARIFNTTYADESFIINRSIGGVTAYPYNSAAQASIVGDILNYKKGDNINESDFKKFIDKFQAAIVSNFTNEIDKFKTNYKEFKDIDLVIVWMGANDILWVAQKFDPNIDNDQVVRNAAFDIQNGLSQLVENGAKNIIVIGLPDFDLAPRFNQTPSKSAQVLYFNSMLVNITSQLSISNEKLKIVFVDKDNIYKNIIL